MIERLSWGGTRPSVVQRALLLEWPRLNRRRLRSGFQKTPEELFSIYGVFGGTHAYLEHVDESLSAKENAQTLILSEKGAPYDEPEILLTEEVRRPDAYWILWMRSQRVDRV
jgi:hypothetical protein